MALQLLILTLLAGSGGPGELSAVKDSAQSGPIDFTCEAMQLFSNPNRAICNREVVVRRGELFLCCERFEGYMDEQGGWERLICYQRVRAQRRGEMMWADRATFILATNDLILTGHPKLQRGKSVLSGERIVVDTERDQAHIEQPRGRLEPATREPVDAAQLPLTGELPRKCPIPAAPPEPK